MFIPDPRSWFLATPDPRSKTATKERGEKKFVVITFYVATNFTKLQIISVLNCWRKQFGPIFKELQNFFTKIVNKFSKIWGWDPGSEILDPEKTSSGSPIQGQKGTGSHALSLPPPVIEPGSPASQHLNLLAVGRKWHSWTTKVWNRVKN